MSRVARADPGVQAGVPLRLRDGTDVWLRSAAPHDACAEHAEILAMEAGGLVIGRAAYSRVYGPRAALTLDVAASYADLGVPTALLCGIGPAADAGGISTFMMRVPVGDVRTLALLVGRFHARMRREGLDVDIEVAVRALNDQAPP